MLPGGGVAQSYLPQGRAAGFFSALKQTMQVGMSVRRGCWMLSRRVVSKCGSLEGWRERSVSRGEKTFILLHGGLEHILFPSENYRCGGGKRKRHKMKVKPYEIT